MNIQKINDLKKIFDNTSIWSDGHIDCLESCEIISTILKIDYDEEKDNDPCVDCKKLIKESLKKYDEIKRKGLT